MSDDNTNNDQPEFTPEMQAQIQKVIEERVQRETEGLVKKRDELLAEAKAAKGKLREIQDKYGEDFSKFDKLIAEEQKRKEAEMTLEERLSSRFENEKKQLSDMWGNKEKEYQTVLGKKDAALKKYLIDSQLESEISKNGGIPHFLKPALTPLLNVVQKGDDYTVMVMDGDSPRLKLDGSPMGISDLITHYKNDPAWAPAFNASGASGGDASGSKSNGKSATGYRPRSQMSSSEKADAVEKLGYEGYLALPE
jgi:hypothetical protein